MAITMFVSLYTTRLILNGLGASDYGIYNIVGGAIAMLGFLNGSMASATQRFMSYAEGAGDYVSKKSIFNISIVLHFSISIFVGIALIIAGFFFFNGILNIPEERTYASQVVYASLVVSTVFTIMAVPYDAVLNSHENMKFFAFVGMLESFLKLIIAYLCLHSSYDKLIVYGILMACVPLFTFSIMLIYCHRKYVECVMKPQLYWSKNTAKEIGNFAMLNLGNTMIIMVSAQGYAILLNNFFGALLNAAQGIAGQINGQLQVLSSNMMRALNPVFGKSAGADNTELLFKSTFWGAKMSTALYLMIAIPVFLEAPYILELWLKRYPEWTVLFVRLQLFRTFIEFSFGTIPNMINATGKIKKYTFLSSFFNIFQLPVAYVVFRLGGEPYYIYIVAIIFANILVYISALYCAKEIISFPVKDFLFNVVLKLTSTVFITVIIGYLYIYIFGVDDLVSLLIYMLLVFVFFLIIFFIVGNSKMERQYIIKIVETLCNRL